MPKRIKYDKLVNIESLDETAFQNGFQISNHSEEVAKEKDYFSQANGVSNIMCTIYGLSESVKALRQSAQVFHQNFESFQNDFHDYYIRKQTIMQQQIPQEDNYFDTELQKLDERRKTGIEELRCIIIEYDQIQILVFNELKTWQRNQALSGNGARHHDNLDHIQRYFEDLTETICNILGVAGIIGSTESNGDSNQQLKQLGAHAREQLQVLVLSSFVVEKQPPQVMKTHTKFISKVRWLIGSKLGIHVNNPIVHCIILSESQAKVHSQQRTVGLSQPNLTGEIENNKETMEFDAKTNSFHASFKNMQLNKIKRSEKKGTESVTDEKFALLFHATTTLNGYRIQVWTLSLPIVVIVHGNQEPQSWATITWDNAFSNIIREPFQVPDKIPWLQLMSALSTKFNSVTAGALTADHLNVLYEKLAHNNRMYDENNYITWSQFCKDPLPDRTFTFWDWFYAIMKLIKDHFQALWKAGLVVGFISKTKAIENLNQKSPGTFLLRFSDSELGGITVAFKDDRNQVLMLAPWTAKDLHIRALADIIFDLPVLSHVYPYDEAKNTAFKDFYTQSNEQPHGGYLRHTIRAHVPAIEGTLMSATPRHQMQSPHAHDVQVINNPDAGVMTNLDLYDDFSLIFIGTNGN